MNYSGGVATPLTTSTTAAPISFTSAERKSAVEEAGTAADTFYKLFYKTFELRPHRVPQLYLDSAVLIWDGNPYVHTEAIKKFYDGLPSLTFIINSMDSQPLPSQAVGGNKSFMIMTGGTIRVPREGPRSFTQKFVITAQGDTWKIASDVFRSQLSPTSTSA